MMPTTTRVMPVSPLELFTGIKTDHSVDCKVAFGEYVQVYEESESQKSQVRRGRTMGAIAVNWSRNRHSYLLPTRS
jgi:hypothetical protein